MSPVSRNLSLTLLVAAVVVFAVHFLDFPGSVPDFEKDSGGGTLLDVRPAFSEDAIRARFEGYGEAGRESYSFRNATIDILLPLSVLPFLFLFMRHAIENTRLTGPLRSLLISLPFAYVVFDLAENGAVSALLRLYPGRLGLLAALLPYLTVIKRAASMLALLIPILLLAVAPLRSGPRSISGEP